jgi:CheY-like chemotaxis protein
MATILLADDEHQLRQLLADQLRQSGYEVMEAADGAEAWELLNDVQVDLVISDINMPKVSGVTLARWIIAMWPHMPIILLSGMLPLEGRSVLTSPVARFVRKPISLNNVKQVIARLLARRAVA